MVSNRFSAEGMGLPLGGRGGFAEVDREWTGSLLERARVKLDKGSGSWIDALLQGTLASGGWCRRC